MVEEWRPCLDFLAYEASNLGRLRRADTYHVLKPRLSGWGYQQVMFSKGGQIYTKTVHRVVLEAFLGPGEGLEANHIDGVKTNNRLENLEWVTKAENNKHAADIGLRKSRATAVKIDQTGEEFPTVKSCAEHLGTYPTVVSAVLKGKLPHYKRYTFSYVR